MTGNTDNIITVTDGGNTYCKACSSVKAGCKTCSDKDTCTGCMDGYVLLDGVCYSCQTT